LNDLLFKGKSIKNFNFIYSVISLSFTAALIFLISCASENKINGVVSAAAPEAVEAGLIVLDAGGNAVDAAVAISFALAVTEPAQSGLGGQIQFLVHFPGSEPLIINGTSFSPSVLPENIDKTNLVKHKASTVPSIVKVLYYLWKEYGSKKIVWEELLQPAINYAKDGIVLGEFRYKVLEYKKDDLLQDSVTRKIFLNENGSIPAKKEKWKQPILTRTLKRIAKFGADDFYIGGIAKTISEDMKRNNSWITLSDLNNVSNPTKQRPIKGSYRGYEIYTMPPPGGGWVIIQALNILEQFSSDDLTLESKNRLKVIAQALQLAHQSRSDERIENLINYQKDVIKKTSKEEAEQLFQNFTNGETTHFSVVDENEIVVSATSSINNYFGSKSASPELGFLYNDYMNEYKINEPNHPFNLIPNAMPYSSMTPTILMKDGKTVMAIGSPGSERIISAIVQVISLWIDAGLSIEKSVAHARIHVAPDSIIYLESNDYSQEVLLDLKETGFTFNEPPSEIIINNLNPYFGGVHAVALEDNVWNGSADPRRDGAVGYNSKR
jgi:gamma-glutamyltranspeptidase/glutathione hydrolase